MGQKKTCYQCATLQQMGSPHDNRRDHVLREPLERAVAQALADKADVKKMVEAILLELDEQNIIAYKPKGFANLFTPAGRLVIMLLERPRLTVREMSVTLGCSSTAIIKAISVLNKDGLVKRKKSRGRYEYTLNHEKVAKHPELRRLIALLHSIDTMTP